MASDRPNVLLIMTDEERHPPHYETDVLAEFRSERLPAHAALAARGVCFDRHYTAATACLPSRSSLFTGQYPSLHGVRNTDGLAKSAADPAMVWLDPDQVPTMGDWFRAAGYETHYRGKWHISHAEMCITGTHHAFLTNTADGAPIPDAVDAYRRADRLEPYGFSGWIGPEPHGANPANTGLARDGLFAQQVTDLLDRFGARKDDSPPWLCVASFVNPHDIVFSGMGWKAFGFPPVPDWVPEVPEAPSQSDRLDDRPAAQQAFREAWSKMLYPQPADEEYRRLYHFLIAEVDTQIGRILHSLERNGLADDTVVVLTSDHGDMLGAHGGLQQKWHNAYDEAIRVPLVVAGPGIGGPPGAASGGIAAPTSHIDILPTLLGLVGASPQDLAPAVSAYHTEVRDLPGRNLSGLLLGAEPAPEGDAADPIYFMTEDQISRGLRNVGLVSGQEFEPVPAPAAVETVVAEHDGRLWKLNRYYAGPDGPPHDAGAAASDRPGAGGPEDWELHDLSGDPGERENLVASAPATTAAMRDHLERIRATHRLAPTAPAGPG
ncbi:MAG: sulfatase-like hydrolase/transferase [Microthrixaceae bacterium]